MVWSALMPAARGADAPPAPPPPSPPSLSMVTFYLSQFGPDSIN